MTKDEAKARTIKGIWNNISKYITDRIEATCDCGENEVRVEKNGSITSRCRKIEKTRI